MDSPTVSTSPMPSSMVARMYTFLPSILSNLAVQRMTPGVGTGLRYVVFISVSSQFVPILTQEQGATYTWSSN